MSVVDNVLLVHQVDAKVVILYDIFTDSRAPISAPLPLLLRGFPGPNTDVRSSKQGSASLEADAVPDEAIVYGDGWKFLVPDLICDHVNKLVWKIHVDLEVVVVEINYYYFKFIIYYFFSFFPPLIYHAKF